jgi:hypothetical protein
MFKGAIVVLIGLLLAFIAINQFSEPPMPESVIDDSSPLAWSTPRLYEDSSPLSDLGGYTRSCSKSADQQTLEIQIDDPESSSFVVEDFAPGTYQCAIKARNDNGGESALSNVVTRTITH